MLRLAVVLAALSLLAAPAAGETYFAFGHIDRDGQETKEGPPAPPWTRTKVEASFFGVPAKTVLSGPVTILPHDPALPAATLPIQKFEPYRREECTGQMSKFRAAEFPELTGDVYRNYVSRDKERGAAWVSLALVIHPARPNAKTLPRQSVAAADLPKGYPLATLEAAFDLSGSGRPDIVQLDYCCYNPAFDNAQCIKAGGKDGGARCTALFQKNKAGWRRLYMARNADC